MPRLRTSLADQLSAETLIAGVCSLLLSEHAMEALFIKTAAALLRVDRHAGQLADRSEPEVSFLFKDNHAAFGTFHA